MIQPSATRVTCSPPASCSTQTSRRSLTSRSVYGAGRTRFARCSAAPPRSSPSTTNGLSAALTWTSTCRRSSLSRRDPSSPPSAALHTPTTHTYPHTHTHTHIHRPRTVAGIRADQEYPSTSVHPSQRLPSRQLYLPGAPSAPVGWRAGRAPDPDPQPYPRL